MSRKRYSEEEIITKLRQAEILISQGKTLAEASKAISVAPMTFSKWRNCF